MKLLRFPVLHEDGSSLDWNDARYSISVMLRGGSADVKHKLIRAPQLAAHLLDGGARWVTELRCPRTLLSRQFSSNSPEQQVKWRSDDVAGDAYLIPGIVAVQDLEIHTAGLNNLIWSKGSTLIVPAGWWLAKGTERSIAPLVSSLVRFRKDPGGRLKPGQMSVSEDSDGTKPQFCVDLEAELYNKRRYDRDVQIAGLIAAFAMLPRSSLREGGEGADSQVASQLRDRLESEGLADWNEDGFDPALAATALESFYLPKGGDD